MKRHHPLLLLILSISTFFGSASAEDFVFNGFNSSDMLLYGVADIESRVLTLTNQTSFAIGRALYPSKIPAKSPNSSDVVPFSTSFIFSIAPYEDILPGHGIVFLFAPVTGIEGATSSQHLGFLNRTNDGNSTNHVFGVKFDVFKNEEFGDISDNHVGINVNSLTSMSAHEAGYWPDNGKISSGGGNSSSEEDEKSFKRLQLNNGKNYQVWIDYMDFHINVTMAVAGKTRPQRPLLSVALNLSDVFLDDMYVGFTAATGRLVESHRILAWSFSNSNFSLSSELITSGLPSFVPPKKSIFQSKGFIAGITVGVFFCVVFCSVFSWFLIRWKRLRARRREGMEEWELEYWPHRITHQEIEAATNGFSEENVIGTGGNGKVYKGVLEGGAEIAVKRISHENDQGMREFVAEISSLGRLKHRCLVSLRGWCKRENGSFMLVYDYMENGSLDKRVFECEESKLLSFKDRIRVLKDVASGVLYLHEGWESKVLHRDIKASNVLLDRDMNGRLGDFGLARMHGHDKVGSTTRVVGTVGYLAPEVIRTGRASAQTDVFGFGVLILEVLCGRRPMEEGKQHLIDWVWELMMKGELVLALDERLRSRGELDEEEVEKVLHLGLLCTYPDPSARPTMRQVVKILEGGNEVCESEGEEMDAYLLESVRSKSMWSKYSHTFGRGSHPTFEDFRQSLASSMSMSWSDAILDGR
ncbi:L-type lectin-domain containing receptor kinase VII.1-like [Vitis vinifera]|uniref:L-type lectin-domain containing receptor kinase VII.1-like n=1 Tax=Vitis vinifera TaxID=29760 RepID=UPI0008FEC44B|nr:L-type lectin-domain containing receptor kinase VII.1-like [Vitis vinifera]|eukprot:XP_019073824.1 PREDICTED: L-type lectin-domain containing receptor kinase VII.1-like isoform X2 [Vitis vinifera]